MEGAVVGDGWPLCMMVSMSYSGKKRFPEETCHARDHLGIVGDLSYYDILSGRTLRGATLNDIFSLVALKQ